MPSTMSPSTCAREPAFSQSDFRATLSQFATGVTVITCFDAERGPVGLTASSFNSVSLHPPLVLWSLALSAGSMSCIRKSTHYAVNILAADQQALADRFSRKGVDRFSGVPWRHGHSGAPILEGAAGHLECFNRSRYDEGDHTIFVGEVERCERVAGAPPLVFHAGRFFTSLAC